MLSLNEKTQEIEPHRINALFDMGVKPVYRLYTASGRHVKTTANHPYLTKNGWVKVSGLKAGDEIAVPKEINDQQVLRDESNYSLKQALQSELQQGQLSFPCLITSFFRVDKKGSNNKYYCHNAQKNSQKRRKFLKEICGQTYSTNSLTDICKSFSNKFLLKLRNLHQIDLYHIVSNLSNLFKRNAGIAYAQPALENAVLWDKIISIEYIGYEHVWDIEVDGTHNFIANGIFAHNTYTGVDAPVTSDKSTSLYTAVPAGADGTASAGGVNGLPASMKKVAALEVLRKAKENRVNRAAVVIGDASSIRPDKETVEIFEVNSQAEADDKKTDLEKEKYLVLIINIAKNTAQVSNLPAIAMDTEIRQAVKAFLEQDA